MEETSVGSFFRLEKQMMKNNKDEWFRKLLRDKELLSRAEFMERFSKEDNHREAVDLLKKRYRHAAGIEIIFEFGYSDGTGALFVPVQEGVLMVPMTWADDNARSIRFYLPLAKISSAEDFKAVYRKVKTDAKKMRKQKGRAGNVEPER